MADEIKLEDHPSTETQMYMFGRAINSLIREIREQNEKIESNTNSINQWALLQKEQNGNVAKIKEEQLRIHKRLDAHDDWHDDEDTEKIRKIHEEEIEKARREGKNEGIKHILGLEINVVKWIMGGGLIGAGAVLGKLIHMTGFW